LNENDKKPFYKRNWFWITILSMFIVVSATTYIANYSYLQDKADQTTVKQGKNQSEKKVTKSPSLVTKYNSIKTGSEGYVKDEVIKVLGNPTSTQDLNTDNGMMILTWDGTDNNSGVTIQITFEKNIATAKSIQGLDIDRKKLLTMKDYDKLQIGDKYSRVTNILGDPDNYSDMNGVKTLTYMSDLDEIDPTQATNIQVKISNNKIITKSQVNLK